MSVAGRVRIAGIDPGSNTGLVILELPPASRDLTKARWVRSESISGLAASQTRTKAEGHAELFHRLSEWLRNECVEQVAMECPIDATPVWGRATGRTKGAGRSTLFGSGANYGLCLAACAAARCRVTSYRVQTTKKHEGWMPMARSGHLVHVQKRNITLYQLRTALRSVNGFLPIKNGVVDTNADITQSEDELMAFGVLRYHLTRVPTAPEKK